MRILGGHQISIQRKVRSADSQGGHTESFITITTERGKVRPASLGGLSLERTVGDQAQARVTHVAYLRAKADIKIEDRLIFADLTFEVIGFREPGHLGKHKEIDCKELLTAR